MKISFYGGVFNMKNLNIQNKRNIYDAIKLYGGRIISRSTGQILEADLQLQVGSAAAASAAPNSSEGSKSTSATSAAAQLKNSQQQQRQTSSSGHQVIGSNFLRKSQT